MLLASVAEGEAIGAGVRIADVDGHDADGDAGGGERLRRLGQPFVVGLPPEQATEQAHVRALACVR